MALRSECLCDGKIIGIESIFTVINGQQINIPDKLKWLRSKSDNRELFCPCGCGANLILVAGDRNLREQHFRLKDDFGGNECQVITEGKVSVASKIVLKCWLDDKLQAKDVESRIPIRLIDDVKRKYEFTFLSKEKQLGIIYSHERSNLSEEKHEILEKNSQGIRLIYIVDEKNYGFNGQYPEAMMKVQEKQGYCLFLHLENLEYDKAYGSATLKAVYYDQDIDGLWREIVLAEGKLTEFSIQSDLCIAFQNNIITDLLAENKIKWQKCVADERNRRAELKKQQEEYLRNLQAERERQEQEREKQLEEYRKKQQEEEEKRKLETERKREERKLLEEARKKEEEKFRAIIESGDIPQDMPFRDSEGNRWVKCKFCGKVAKDSEFGSYGGAGTINLGTCYECGRKPEVINAEKSQIKESSTTKKAYDPNICPACGNKLRLRTGMYGTFYGCSNYPTCKYTRKK